MLAGHLLNKKASSGQRFQQTSRINAGLATPVPAFVFFGMNYVHLALAVAGLTVLLAAYTKFVIVPGLKHLV